MSKPAPKNATNKELVQLQADVEELKQFLQRERADFNNFRRRSDEERGELANLVKKEVVLELLPLLDNLSRAAGHLPKELEQNDWARGVLAITKQADEVLKSLGVEKIVSLHQPFDPRLHEAMSYTDGSGDHEVVAEELAPGYILGETVLRPAMVKVTKTNLNKPEGGNNG